MKFSFTGAALLALAARVLAQTPGFDVLSKPESGEVLQAGTTYTIVWTVAPTSLDDESVSLYVMAGNSNTTLVVDEANPIARSVVNKLGQVEWDIPSTLGDKAAYGIKVVLDSDPSTFQFSNPFTIKAAQVSSTTSSSSTSSSSAAPSTTEAPSSSSPEPTTTKSEPVTTKIPTYGNSTTLSVRPSVSRTASASSSPTGNTQVNSGVQAKAGAIALIGGLALAAFAL